jgi:DNA-binding transcriptional regulator YhcF (GntR family)
MSLKALSWAWEQAIPPIQKLVLVAIADYANTDAKTWYSVSSIAKKCNIHATTASRALHSLEAAKLVSIEARPNKTNVYSLPLTPQSAGTVPAERGYPQSATPQQSAGTVPAERYAGTSGALYDTIKNRNTVNISDDQIEALYSAYPRKANKPAALAAIRKALKREAEKHDLGMSYPALLEKTKLWNTSRSQATAKDEDAAKFTKYAATWFNQQCYLEDSAEWDIKSITKSWLDAETDQLLRESEASVRATEKMLADLDK